MANLIETLQAAPEQVLPAGQEERQRRSKIAQAMLMNSIETSPVQHWTQGAARVMQALVGGGMAGDIARDANAEQKRTNDLLMNLPGLTGSQPQAPSSPAATALTPTAPAAPQNASRTGMFDPGDTEMQAGLMTPMQFQPEVLDAAKRSGIDPLIFAKQLKQESNFNPNAVSPKGAQGISQFMPATAAERGVNPADPTSSINGGADYLASLKQKFGGRDDLALMAYNWGEGNVQKWVASGADPTKIPAETRNYVATILGQGQGQGQGQPQPQGAQPAARDAQSLDAQTQGTIRALLANPQTRAMGMQLYGQFAKPSEYGFQTLPDGTVVKTDPRRGTATPIMSAPKPATYGVIGEDQYGQKRYGWIDANARQTTPGTPAGSQPPAPAGPAPDGGAQPAPAALPAAPGTIPPPPPGVDPKEWRKEQTKLAVGKQAAEGQRQKYADVVTTDIDRMMGIIDKNPGTTTGALGNVLQNVPGTNAHNASALAETIRANVGFDRLQEMRNASPTGGALGQVSDAENKLLASTIGNLSQSQSKEQLMDNLRRVKNVYMDIIHGKGQGPEREKLSFNNKEAAPQSGAPQAGHVEDGFRFKGGDPAKPENWERAQ